MPELIPAALSAAEWTGVLANRASLDSIRDQFLDTPFSPHALAALLLYDEPFGFSAQDVEDEREVAAYCRAMTTEHAGRGQDALALTFRLPWRTPRDSRREDCRVVAAASVVTADRDRGARRPNHRRRGALYVPAFVQCRRSVSSVDALSNIGSIFVRCGSVNNALIPTTFASYHSRILSSVEVSAFFAAMYRS